MIGLPDIFDVETNLKLYTDSVMNKKFNKELKLLHRKNDGKCSICKVRFSDDELTFTSIGYDKRRKLQITTYCCDHAIVDLKNIGVFGVYDPEELEDLIQDHPRHGELFSEEKQHFKHNEYDAGNDFLDLPSITDEDRDIVAKTVKKYLNAQALMLDEEDAIPDAFIEIEQIFTKKYNDSEIAQQKCMLILAEISSFDSE